MNHPPWGVVPASVRECFDTVPLGTRVRDNPAIETGFQRGTNNDLVSHRHDQGERVASRVAICRVRSKKGVIGSVATHQSCIT